MKIHEIFASIQGEGSDTGRPYVFIRFAGCNLDCSYCDTKRARTGSRTMDLDSVIRAVRGFQGLKRVLITGGEPLGQKPAVIALASRLLKNGYEVSLETNGSISLKGLPAGTHVVMDVKTPSSGESGKSLISNLGLLGKTDEVKFVISGRPDYVWASHFVKEHGIFGGSVLFSPAWNKLSGKKPGSKPGCKLCSRLGSQMAGWIMEDRLDVRLQVQLHKLLCIK